MKKLSTLFFIVAFGVGCKETKRPPITTPCAEFVYERRAILFEAPAYSDEYRREKQKELDSLDSLIVKFCSCDTTNKKQ